MGTCSKTKRQISYWNQMDIDKKKLNENKHVVRNKARILCKVYAQVQGIDFEETFSLVARLETTRCFLHLHA